MPCSEKRARRLLARGRARVHRVVPFVIRLTDHLASDCAFQPLRVKLDPGSKHTGLALVRDGTDDAEAGRVVHALGLFQIEHRGSRIRDALTARAMFRRHRRSQLRHRAPRFLNRTKPKGWLAPSLRHRVDTTCAWVERFRHWAPIKAISMESVRFDMQALDDPNIEGAEYQHGTLAGYEIREYLLEKWGRHCAYCGAENVPLQIEHIRPKAHGGSNRVSNLTLACARCNQAKAAQSVEAFLADQPERLRKILAQAKRPLADAAAVNATRWALVNALRVTGLPIELSSGGRTKYNRTRLHIPKAHALDAACVGSVSAVVDWNRPTLVMRATGRGLYARTLLTHYGFPRGYRLRRKSVRGFQTGDRVLATVSAGKRAGTYIGRVAVRVSGSFNIQTATAVVQSISHRRCRLLQRNDGYAYTKIASIQGDAGLGTAKRSALSRPGLKAEVTRAF